MISKEQIKTKHIQAYNLAEFCQEVKQAFEEGFTFDFDTNENYPTSFGTFYSATMILKGVEPTTEAVEEFVEKANKVAGRPKKV